jgi:hypothetical protein
MSQPVSAMCGAMNSTAIFHEQLLSKTKKCILWN